MIKLVACAYCGMEFEPTYYNRKFCSPECKIEGYAEHRKEYESRSGVRQRRDKYNKEYYSKPEVRKKRYEWSRNSRLNARLNKPVRVSRIIEPFPGDIDRNAFGYWLSGFTDGEGSFGLRVSEDKRYLDCFNIGSSFSIGLRDDDEEILRKIQSYWMCGLIHYRTKVKVNKKGIKSKPSVMYRINDVTDLMNVVVPHFNQFPLLAKKGKDFVVWSQGVELAYEVKNRPIVGGFGVGRCEVKWTDTDIERFSTLAVMLKEGRKYTPRRAEDGDS